MIEIKSLKRITEADAAHDIRYKADIAAAKSAFEKTRKEHASWNPIKILSPSHNRLAGEAKADRDMAIDAAEERLKAAKKGMVSKQDHDEIKFEAARAKVAAATKAKQEAGSDIDKAGILHKIGKHLADNVGPYAVAAAGIAGVAALQKRKNRLPEPGRY